MKLYEYAEVADWIKPQDHIRVNIFMELPQGLTVGMRCLGIYNVRQNHEMYEKIEILRFTTPTQIDILVDRDLFIDLLAENIIAPNMEE